MKITHNKVGQNLNLTDAGKSDKATNVANKATKDVAGTKAVSYTHLTLPTKA